MAAREPKGGRGLPLRPVHGPLPRRAEHRASERTAPGRAHEWADLKPHFEHTCYTELQAQGMYDEAEPLYRKALEVWRETLGDRHPDTLTSMNDLGLLVDGQGRPRRC